MLKLLKSTELQFGLPSNKASFGHLMLATPSKR
jgi:hypothetical protein